jgi:RHS repeat-associated protein
VRKYGQSASSTVLFAYDRQGHLGEYDNTGAALKEYVWLGDEPVAMFMPNGANPPSIFYFHSDHINTPRVVVDRSNNLRWRWMSEPFGTTAAETNPSGLGALTFNLRMPGQYFDSETGLFYNWHRDYDPGGGRYAQSDPIGLEGGINSYAYAKGDSLRYIDPHGTFVWFIPAVTGAVGGLAGGVGNYIVQRYIQGNCTIDWGSVANATVWGAAAGATLPYAGGVGGAMAVGAAANVFQYVTGQAISGGEVSAGGALAYASIGAAGGSIGGAFTRTVWYGASQTALPELARQSASYVAASANSSASNLARNLAGGIVGNIEFNPRTGEGCTCTR